MKLKINYYKPHLFVKNVHALFNIPTQCLQETETTIRKCLESGFVNKV